MVIGPEEDLGIVIASNPDHAEWITMRDSCISSIRKLKKEVIINEHILELLEKEVAKGEEDDGRESD